MKVSVKVEVTTDEINILQQASEIIKKIADDIDNEQIIYFAGYECNDLYCVVEDIDKIVETLKKEE